MPTFRPSFLVVLFCFCSGLFFNASAQQVNHRWILPAPWHDPKATFTNINNGDRAISPFVVEFGMSNWGIAPAKHNHAKTGHHHLLIDADLPIPHTKPIPFSKNYMHFGAGQMEAVLDLPVGNHRLRLLLADHAHVPLTVFSQEITVVVTSVDDAKRQALKARKPELSFANLDGNETLKPNFKVQFHASGLNVATSLTKLANTGHFQLTVNPSNKSTESIAFPTGATETWLELPEGDYKLTLNLIDNATGQLSSVAGKAIAIKVKK